MKRFADLYAELDGSTKINDKVGAMERYFRDAPAEDAVWGVYFLSGRRPKRLVQSPKLQAWATELADVPPWLFGECYDAVGDLAEAIALLLGPDAVERAPDEPLHVWMRDVILPLAGAEEAGARETVTRAWLRLDGHERFLFNKLITGSFRVGVSQELVMRALGKAYEVPVPKLAHRLMGEWPPTPEFFTHLVDPQDTGGDFSRPYPFCLAYALESPPEALGERDEWLVEWKWDGIRAQVVRRQGQTFVWSRGEDLVTERFPEIRAIGDRLPDGTVLDGEIMPWREGRAMRFADLQKRIGRKDLGKKILEEVPVTLIAFDLLEWEGQDVRDWMLKDRRAKLDQLDVGFVQTVAPEAVTWADLAALRERSREFLAEGFMLKRLDSAYQIGRRKGSWWKWKVDPLTVDAVMVYAQRGSGRRASLYSDYTFALWNEQGELVPFARAYSGLTDEEMRRVDAWVRRHTKEKFGPVRTVDPELVMELAFEGIQLSNRHKSGIAVRFPRILRWRHDKKPEDADRLSAVKDLVRAVEGA